MRALSLAVVLAAVALASGCGSSGDAGEASGAERATDAAREAGSGLSQHQYDELEEMLVAMLPLDEVAGTTDPKAIRARLAEAAAACGEVDRRDPLLAAMVDGCERTFAAFGSSAMDCSTAAVCGRAMASVADAMDELATTVRENQPTIARAVPAGPCLDVLLSAEEVETAEAAVPVFRRAAKAIASGDPAAIAAVEDDMADVEARESELPSVREELRGFRRHCRPERA